MYHRETLTELLEGDIAEFSPCDMSLGLKVQETNYWRWSQEKGLERLEQVPQLWDLVVVSCHTVLVHLNRSPCHHRLVQEMQFFITMTGLQQTIGQICIIEKVRGNSRLGGVS